MQLSVVGGNDVDAETTALAYDLGKLLAGRAHTVICGGRGGVMEAVCRGAQEKGGHTVGILPGPDADAANRFVETPIVTDAGNARNVFVALTGDAMIALEGSHGTRSEIAHALDAGRPVVGLDREPVDGIEVVESPTAAVDVVEAAVD